MTKLEQQIASKALEELDFFEDEYIIFERRNFYVFGVYKKGKTITLEAAKQIVRKRQEFCGFKDTLFLATENGIKGIERKARQYLSSPEGVKGVKAGAMVSKTALATHLANFFMKISIVKTSVPIKLFRSVQEAEKWLKEYRD